MKNLILLSLISILATGCFNENGETNPFIQSEIEKQVAAGYRDKVDLLQAELAKDKNNLKQIRDEILSDLERVEDKIINKTAHSITFKDGSCGKIDYYQIPFSGSLKLNNFSLILGGVFNHENNLDIPVPNSDDNKDWKARINIFINDYKVTIVGELNNTFNHKKFTVRKAGLDITGKFESLKNFYTNQINYGDMMTVTVQWGVNHIVEDVDYSIDEYRDHKTRVNQAEFIHCKLGNSILNTNKRLILSFDESSR